MLEAVRRGEPRAADQLLPLVYDELRRLAAATPGSRGPRPDAPAHRSGSRGVSPADRARSGPPLGWPRPISTARRPRPCDASSSTVARDRKRLKRGGDRTRRRYDLEGVIADEASPDDLIDLDDALGRLALIDPRGAELVKLRLYRRTLARRGAAPAGLGVCSLRIAPRSQTGPDRLQADSYWLHSLPIL